MKKNELPDREHEETAYYQSKNHQQYVAELKEKVLCKLDCWNEIEDEKVLEWIDEVIVEEGKNAYLTLSKRRQIRQELFNALRKLDVLQELVDRPDITEIMVNGKEKIFIEQKGRLFKWDKHFETRERLEDVIQQIVSRTNRLVNEMSPIVDTRLENGSRVNIVLPPIALDGPVVTIRRFPDDPITMDQLLAFGALDQDTADFLGKLVRARYNIFISGGTGSGKTTFLNVLSDEIPSDERIITIEDSAELQIRNIPNLVRLETRNSNVEGKNEVTIRDLIKTALRMRPDRIIVGEVRGAECVELMSAFNTGHDGSLSTGHANSAKDMLSRMEMMILMGMDIPLPAIQRQIAAGIDIIVHLGRLRDKSRKLLTVTEVEGCENGEFILNPIIRFVQMPSDSGKVEGKFERCGALKNRYKLIEGMVESETQVTGETGL